MLVEIYYHALAKEEFKPSLEEFKEELALAHIISYAKAIIGAGVLDKNDRNTCEVMNILAARGIKSMIAHDTIGAFEAFRGGTLISQKRMASASAGPASGEVVAGATPTPESTTPLQPAAV